MTHNTQQDSYKNGKIIFIIGTIVCITSILGILALYAVLGSLDTKAHLQKNTPPIKEQIVNELEQKDWKFEVVNASGIRAYENDVRDVLMELGYSILSTASAEVQDTSTLRIRPDMSEKKEALLNDLDDFFRITTVSTDLPSFGEANAQITLGKN